MDHKRNFFLSRFPFRWLLAAICLAQLIPLYARSLHPKGMKRIEETSERKLVALTLDDGPHPKHTEKVLRVLASYGVTATFFVVGENIKRYPELLREIVNQGHSLGNHSYSHPNLTRMSEAQIYRELERTNRLIKFYSGTTPLFFRPPYGLYNQKVRKVAHRLGLTMVLWDATANDFYLLPPEKIERQVIQQVKPNSIILLHDGGGNRSRTVKALKTIIPLLLKKGFSFVTLWELEGKSKRIF